MDPWPPASSTPNPANGQMPIMMPSVMTPGPLPPALPPAFEFLPHLWIVPPFTMDTAHAKVKALQYLWNTRDVDSILQWYTELCSWRVREVFLTGTAAIQAFLDRKWQRERSSRLRGEVFAVTDNRIAVQYWYEFQDACDGWKWKRCYGLDYWSFAPDGRIYKRQTSGNDKLITDEERWFDDGVDVNQVHIPEEHW